jgi:hypothetical protein
MTATDRPRGRPVVSLCEQAHGLAGRVVPRTVRIGMAEGTPGYSACMRTRSRRTSSIGMVLLLVWLVIGAIAAGQRGYFTSNDTSCASTGTIIVTVLAGPLNYLGINPQIQCPTLPQPSE